MDKFERGQRTEIGIYEDACALTDEEIKLYLEMQSKNSVDTGINIFDDRLWLKSDDGIEIDKFKDVHPIFRPGLEAMYKNYSEEALQDIKFCYYGHIIQKPITDPTDMRYWMSPDPWCEQWCGVWDRKLGCCGFANEGDKNG